MYNLKLRTQRGPPPDPRRANRRAHQQPRTSVTEAIRGSFQQPRTGMRRAIRGEKSNRIMNICTYNPRTINDLNTHALDTMLYEIEKINWDIIGFSETKEKESKIVSMDESGFKLFLSGNDISRSNGVGFLVNKSFASLVDDYQPISDRLAVLTLQSKFSKIVFIQCYFPTSTYPDEDITDMYDQIETIIKNVPRRDHLFIMGDFNCKVGNLHVNYPDAIGKHTVGQANERGELLAEFCTRNNLVITNTKFSKRKLHTWTSPDGKTKNQIDFILTRKPSARQNILDSTALNAPDISDHRMVRTKVRMSFSWPERKAPIPKYNLESLFSDKKEPFQLKLSNRFSSLQETTVPEDIFQQITSGILETAKEILPLQKKSQCRWMSTKTKEAIETKHKIRKQIGDKSPEYKVAKAESKKLVRKDKLQQIEKDIDVISNLPPHKQYYAAIKRLKSKPKEISWAIKDSNGNILTDKESILERWAKFYEELYHDDPVCTNVDDAHEDAIPIILRSEVEQAIQELKTGKSPGLDNIYSEYIKAGGEPLMKAFLHLFHQILVTGNIPSKFPEALIVVLYKKKSRLECGNYRPISLLSHIYKVFISIIASRVKNDLYASFPNSQAAYQSGRGTIEQIIALEQIIEKSIEFNNPVHIAFIDYTKAFDSIKLDCLWKLLEDTSMNKKYINLLKLTYDNSTAVIKTDIGITRPVKILKGVKQGDVLSALLFCIVIAAIILKAESDCKSGFSIGGHLLSNLSYADDIAAINRSQEELQAFLDCLVKYSAEVGLFINVSKTECMTTNKNKDLYLTINGKQIKQVNQFAYLGHKLSATNDGTPAVKHRIGLGWAAFEKNKILLTSTRVPYHIKAKVYKTYILPVVLYGLECVNWTVKLEQQIETFQNHIMRFMTGHKLIDHVKIEELLNATTLDPIMSVIKSKVLKLFGHVKRSEVGLSRLCLEGMIEGKRNRGRPPKRWRDNVYAWSQMNLPNLNTTTKDRNLWKDISCVSAQSATSGGSER